MAKSKIYKTIALCLFVILFVSVINFTYAYFSDRKNASININLANMQNESTAETLVSAEELIAGATFTKTLTVNLTSTYNYYYRVYAEVVIETYNELDEIVERTDLVEVTNVTELTKETDNKFYTNEIALGSHTKTYTFTFEVSNLVGEELYTKSDFTIDRTLTSKVVFYIEHCQSEGYEGWVNN